MSILLNREEVMGLRLSDVRLLDPSTIKMLEAQAEKIALKLQSIYNLPDEGMFRKKMGKFIQELLECTK